MTRLTGPCIDVCRYLRPGPAGARCIGCAMTEADKAAFKALPDDAARLTFLQLIVARQVALGGYSHWPAAYAEKCARKAAPLPMLDPSRAA